MHTLKIITEIPKRILVSVSIRDLCFRLLLISFGLFILIGCTKEQAMFTQLDSISTGISFTNQLVETEERNILTYEYLYNGGGVATGDFNNDGLIDLYFSGNQVENKLYLNEGQLSFRDVTQLAGVSGKQAWKTGVSVADVNGDGWLDIYVCYSGLGTDEDRADQLFINNGIKEGGVPSFTERAGEYGLDAPGTFTTQAAFFDYDRDGDLDMFQLNHANQFYSPFFNTRQLRQTRHPKYGNRLYRNDEGNGSSPHFTEVSTQAGILGSGLNYGLGIAISDLNGDGYPDIYVTNDYEEQDFCYLNNQDGTFSESLQSSFAHISKYSMGVDIADVNNDLLPDVVTMDMLPEDNHRQKLLRGPDEYDKYQLAVDSGYHRQQMRNMLHLNQGLSPSGKPFFSEIGQLAGISSTDWSWAALLADYNNDGFKDLFVTNGYVRDFTNLDFLKYDFASARQQAAETGNTLYRADGKAANKKLLFELSRKMPSSTVSNYGFENRGDLTFVNTTAEWGLTNADVTTGATYADLDNDGDLDLVTNNTNAPAGIYRNNANSLLENHFLTIKLDGEGKNRLGIGTKVFVKTSRGQQFIEMNPVRGYQSTVDNRLHVGLGVANLIERLTVVWPDGRVNELTNMPVDTMLTIRQLKAKLRPERKARNSGGSTLFSNLTDGAGLAFLHHENHFVDVKSEPLVPWQLSRQGPKMAMADVDGDGNEDVFIGGPSGQAGQLFLQSTAGQFTPATSQPWTQDIDCEDISSAFFDADGDGDVDLYVVSGGNEFPLGSPALQDRLYLNAGKGRFYKAPAGSIPQEYASGSCVVAGDYDQDGDLDLYVGGRVKPGSYPAPSPGGILRNDTDRKTHQVRFTVATQAVCPDLKMPGMVTDACWSDVNGDGWPDLFVVGEWMPIHLFINKNGHLSEQTGSSSFQQTGGFWNCIRSADFDADGDPDYVVGNIGLNTPFKTSEKEPLQLYTEDLNGDGRLDPVICRYIQGVSYPIATRDELLDQMTFLRKKFVRYANYADATIDQILSPEQMSRIRPTIVTQTQSVYLENLGQGHFRCRPLPTPAQFSVVQSIVPGDFTGDGRLDMLLAGNYFSFRVQSGPCDASAGLLLAGDGKGHFQPVDRWQSGLFVTGDVRDLISVSNRRGERLFIAGKNNHKLQVFKWNRPLSRPVSLTHL